MLGLLIGLGCLTRATLPVHSWCSSCRWQRSTLWPRTIGAGRSCAATPSPWLQAPPSPDLFYLINFDYLYYYYAIWNTDANANLPVAESIRHVYFTLDHIGSALIAGLASLRYAWLPGNRAVRG